MPRNDIGPKNNVRPPYARNLAHHCNVFPRYLKIFTKNIPYEKYDEITARVPIVPRYFLNIPYPNATCLSTYGKQVPRNRTEPKSNTSGCSETQFSTVLSFLPGTEVFQNTSK